MLNDVSKYCQTLKYENKSLFIEEVDCRELITKFGTPLYCYSIAELRNNFKRFENSISQFNSMICYAVKANFNPEVVSELARLGSGADVVSIGEIRLALDSGISPEKIVFSGVGKTDDEIRFAIKNKISQINVESYEELVDLENIAENEGSKINISLRVNPDVEALTHEKISTGRLEDKFGISIENTKKIFSKNFKSDLVKLNGLAIHIGSQITEISPFTKAFQKIRKLILEIRKMGKKIETLDLGGGIGINYSNNKVLLLEDYTNEIKKFFGDLDLKIIFEPGRSLVGSTGILLSRVIRIKKGSNKNFVIIDAGMNDLIRPSLYDSYHEIIPTKWNAKPMTRYDIVGPICESSDIFGKNREMNSLDKNDVVAICSVGAYGSCMASTYNCRDLINEIIVNGKKVCETNKVYKNDHERMITDD